MIYTTPGQAIDKFNEIRREAEPVPSRDDLRTVCREYDAAYKRMESLKLQAAPSVGDMNALQQHLKKQEDALGATESAQSRLHKIIRAMVAAGVDVSDFDKRDTAQTPLIQCARVLLSRADDIDYSDPVNNPLLAIRQRQLAETQPGKK